MRMKQNCSGHEPQYFGTNCSKSPVQYLLLSLYLVKNSYFLSHNVSNLWSEVTEWCPTRSHAYTKQIGLLNKLFLCHLPQLTQIGGILAQKLKTTD